MRSRQFIIPVFAILFSICCNPLHAQFKITDTIYYTSSWQICEKPMASYYRAGLLATSNDVWIYTGKIADYTIDNIHVMDGEYAEDGQKEGNFTFYYSNGKMLASGRYHKNTMNGEWHWYYPGGTEKATIFFPGDDEQNFEFRRFTDINDQKTLDNGTGNFNWYVNPFDTIRSVLAVTGSFLSGKRNGEWRYYRPSGDVRSIKGFIEQYNEHGKLISINTDDYKRSNLKVYHWNFTPEAFPIIESIKFNDIFRINGDSLTLNNLAYYLIERRATRVDLNGLVFDTAFATILRTMDQYTGHIPFPQSGNIDFRFEFNIGSTGELENIQVSGTDLGEPGKKYFRFILGKFKNIPVPKDINTGGPTKFIVYYNSFMSTKKMDKGTYTFFSNFFSFRPWEKTATLNENEITQIKNERLNYHRYIGN